MASLRNLDRDHALKHNKAEVENIELPFEGSASECAKTARWLWRFCHDGLPCVSKNFCSKNFTRTS